MSKIQTTLKAIAAAGVLGAFALTCAAQTPAPAAKKKQVKDQGEFEIYNQAIKDANNPTQQLKDLDTWAQKYPDSDFKDDRAYLYMQAYSKVQPPQPLKVIEYGQQLMQKDLKTVFPDPASQPNILTVLFQVAWNVATLPNPTQEQLALGEKAGKELLTFIPGYFVAGNKPANTSEADWTKARGDIENRAKLALTSIRLAPANQALAKNDCATAEKLYRQELTETPDNAAVSYNLGRSLSCLAKSNPDKSAEYATKAIYQFVRAAVTDPTLGGTAEAKKIEDYAKTVYTSYHGSEEGFEQLRQQAKNAAVAPAGFTIESSAASSARKQKEFAEKNPQLALWMGIKGQLTDTNGQQYFEGQLKDADVAGQGGARALKGRVLEGRPACRSRELLIAVPEPGQQAGPAEITLKLDAPLTGKPAAGEVEFDAVPRSFTREPFMLTMETEKSKITGLKVEPCAGGSAPAGKKSAAKKGATTRKKK